MPARKKSAKAAAKSSKNPLLTQIAKFASVGVSNTLIDFTVYEIINIAFGVPAASAFKVKYISGTVAMINSFYWNRRWTFKSKVGVAKSGPRFLVATVVSVYAIQPAIVHFFTTPGAGLAFSNFWYTVESGLGLHVLSDVNVVRIVGFGMGVVGAAIWDFTLYKLWAFKQD